MGKPMHNPFVVEPARDAAFPAVTTRLQHVRLARGEQVNSHHHELCKRFYSKRISSLDKETSFLGQAYFPLRDIWCPVER